MTILAIALKAWLLPTALLLPWTLLTLLLMQVLPLNRKVPLLVGASVVMLMYNPKDDYLYHRPYWSDGLYVVAATFIPLVNWLMLAVQLWVVLWLSHERLQALRR